MAITELLACALSTCTMGPSACRWMRGSTCAQGASLEFLPSERKELRPCATKTPYACRRATAWTWLAIRAS